MKDLLRLWACLSVLPLCVGAPPDGLPAGFDHFYNLEYDEALRAFRHAAEQNPNEASAWNHVAQGILYRQMYRVGALGSELVTGNNSFLRRPKVNPTESDQRDFNDAIERAMTLARARLASDAKNTAALYALGVAHAQRANYNYLVRKAWMDSLKDATAARKLHSQVIELDPGYVDARLTLGIHDYLVGSLPLMYRMLGFLAGQKGDREAGLQALQKVAAAGRANRYDAQIFLAAIYRREHRAQEAVPLLESLIRAFPRNYLFRFELCQMNADLGNKEAAVAVLQQIEQLKRTNAAGYERVSWDKLHSYFGNLYFWYDDLDAALDHLTRATAHAQDLDLNAALISWLRLGQTLDLKGQHRPAVGAYQQVMKLAPGSEIAKEARQYIQYPYRRKQPDA